jgi:hypothetical protein
MYMVGMGDEWKYIHGFVGDTLKETSRWDDNIKMVLNKWSRRAWTGFVWPRIGTGCGLL